MAEFNFAALATVVTTILHSIEYAISTKWIYTRSLKNLKISLTALRSVILGLLSVKEFQSQSSVEKMKDAVYDASDLVDKLITVVGRKQLAKDNRCKFLSSINLLVASLKITIEVEKIRNILDAFALEHNRHNVVLDGDYQSPWVGRAETTRKQETISDVDGGDVIGRKEDVDSIVGKIMIEGYAERNLRCLAVVGVAGSGKTFVARHVYNDAMICSAFDVSCWVATGQVFDAKTILRKILQVLTGEHYDGEIPWELIIEQLGVLKGSRVFLVLDDVWNVTEEEWYRLMVYLNFVSSGSMILVTTRNVDTAGIVGTESMYELKSFSADESWQLFSKEAFNSMQDASPELIKIGIQIVEKCSGIPLALKTVATLLRGQNEAKWRYVLHSEFRDFAPGNEVMYTLKLSFDYLSSSPLKACFSYLALFPKGHIFEKDMLIDLWIAQGYCIPSDQHTTIRDNAEEYFDKLLMRSFLQKFQIDEYGEVVSCVMHNLLHDLAKAVSGREHCETIGDMNNLSSEVRHLTHAGARWEESSCAQAKIRSYFQTVSVHPPVSAVIESCRRLRTLDLHGSEFEYLPDSIGKLLHLRYLNLSKNVNLKELPKSVTKLYNLQTLNLDGCYGLQELPEDLSKLVNLMNLYVQWDGLSYMPPGMNELTSLCVLTSFVLANKRVSGHKCVGQLKDLKSLAHIQGSINISIPECFINIEDDDRSIGVLQNMKHLTAVAIIFHGTSSEENHSAIGSQESLMGTLHPHPNLKGLTISGYQGMSIAMWGMHDNLATFLPNLIRIELRSCQGVKHLPPMCELKGLKSLKLHNLRNLEYIENTSSCSSLSLASETGSSSSESVFFPALEQLELVNLHKLKGWWSREEVVGDNSVDPSNSWQQSSFPSLSNLSVQSCYDLTVMPSCLL